jgi:predicted RNA-binding Zn-ribbon protein involved in translation (DUF1610 family)
MERCIWALRKVLCQRRRFVPFWEDSRSANPIGIPSTNKSWVGLRDGNFFLKHNNHSEKGKGKITMNDFIPLRCPQCGGDIQVAKNLEKFFCTHCGTQLLLRQGTDGLLTPLMARDLTASATMKETQTSLMVIELLKSQIRELEEQSKKVRHVFFQCCVDHIAQNASMGTWFIFRDSKLFELVNRYTQQATNKAQLTQETYQNLPRRRSGTFILPSLVEDWEAVNIPGLNTVIRKFR